MPIEHLFAKSRSDEICEVLERDGCVVDGGRDPIAVVRPEFERPMSEFRPS